MRKDAGLELTDRIVLTIPEADADLLEHEEWIKAETLAVEISSAASSRSRSLGRPRTRDARP